MRVCAHAFGTGVASVQISISVRHGHLSEASQEKLKSRAEKLGRFFERLMSIELVVDLNDEQFPQVDIQVSAEHKHDFVAHAKDENLLGAFDAAMQKIQQQLKKYKERTQDRHRNNQSRHLDSTLPLSEEIPVSDELEEK
jgi:putative sigma-54 modulation protein